MSSQGPPDPGQRNAPLERGAHGADLGEGQRGNSSTSGTLLGQYLLLRNACVDGRLAAGDLGVLAVLIEHYNRREQCARPGLDRIADISGRSRSTVVECVKRLEHLGYVLVERDSTRVNRYALSLPESGAWPAPTRPPRRGGPTSSAGTTSAGTTGAHTPELVVPARTTSPAGTPQLVVPAGPEPALEPTSQPTEEPTKSFARFWEAFPRKEAKQKAQRAWADAGITSAEAEEMLDDVRARIADLLQWRELAFIPLPATYLRERRWEDEWTPAPPDAKIPGESLVERAGRLARQHQERDRGVLEGESVRVSPDRGQPSPPPSPSIDAETRRKIEWINHQRHLQMIDEADAKRQLRALAGQAGVLHGQ